MPNYMLTTKPHVPSKKYLSGSRIGNKGSAPMMVAVKDTGYTKVCPCCLSRWGADARLIGKDRYLDIARCGSCVNKPRKDYA